MGLPYIGQYLFSLHRPDYSPLVFSGITQTIVPVFPSGLTIQLNLTPGQDYAHLIYEANTGHRLIPDAFYVSVIQSGNNQYAGVLTDWFINKEHSWFVVETTGQPTIATVTNQSAFNQYFEVYVLFIRVITKADFLLIMEALDRIGTSKASEVALLQSATLLRQMQYSVTSGR